MRDTIVEGLLKGSHTLETESVGLFNLHIFDGQKQRIQIDIIHKFVPKTKKKKKK
jgi:hypothetical protein